MIDNAKREIRNEAQRKRRINLACTRHRGFKAENGSTESDVYFDADMRQFKEQRRKKKEPSSHSDGMQQGAP